MKLIVALIVSLMAAPLWAQTVPADRVRLAEGPCYVSSQAGPPVQLVLTGNCAGITTSAATNLTLSPTGDLVVDPAGNDLLPALNYDINLGMLSKKFLTLHAAELWVETLVAQNTIATIGGRVLVAPTNLLTADLASGDTSITVKYNNFANGDRAYMEADGKVEFFAITSAPGGSAGAYTYTVTRDLDGSGANEWFAGDAMLNTGTTNDGFIDLYSNQGVLSGTGPTIVGNVRTGTTYNDIAARWAIGNLNGLYGYGADTYGAAFGSSSATNVTVDATNGFRIRSGTTNKLVADTSGNLSIVGDLSVGTSGVIRSNKTGCATGTGWWMSYNGGTPEFCIGNPAGSRLTWDGTTLTLVGEGGGITNINGGNIQTGTVTATQIAAGTITATQIAADTITAAQIATFDLSAISANLGTVTAGTITGVSITTTTGTIGGWTLGATSLTSGTGANTRGVDSGGTNPAFYAGSATPGSAPFRVTAAGALTATNATLTGSLSAGGGDVTINSNGISIVAGPNVENRVSWTDGSDIYSEGDDFFISADSGGSVRLGVGTATVIADGGDFYPQVGTWTLGQTARWRDLYITEAVHISSFDTTTSDDSPVVFSTANGRIYRKTNGASKTCVGTNIVVQSGIVVSCD